MAEAVAAVYPPPGPGLPEVAVIVMNGKVIFAQAVANVAEGEALLRHMLAGIHQLAKDKGYV